MIYRAAISGPTGTTLIHPRTHTYYSSRSAALRSLERSGKRATVDLRGYLWPLAAGDVTTAELAAGQIPSWVETIAL